MSAQRWAAASSSHQTPTCGFGALLAEPWSLQLQVSGVLSAGDIQRVAPKIKSNLM